MRIAAEHVYDAGSRQLEHPFTGGWLSEVRRRGLDECAVGNQLAQPGDQVVSEMPFWVRDDGAEPEVEQPEDRRLKPIVERSGCRLEKDPSPTGAERHRMQVRARQTVERSGGDLTPGQDRQPDAGGAQRSVQLFHPGSQLGDPDVVVVTDVRRRADGRDAIGERLPGHPERVIEIARPVVEAREDVTVQVDQVTSGSCLSGPKS